MRDTEVHDLRMSIIIDSDVRGLDVAMDDAVLVRVREPHQHIDDDVELRLQLERLGADHELLEIGAVDELHRDEEMSVELAQVVDRDDIGMLE